MAENATPSALGELRAAYKAIVGKNPSPRLNAEALEARIAELKANPPAPGAPEPKAAKAPKAPTPPKAPKEPRAPAEPAPEAPSGTALLDHDDPDASASHAGVEIVRGKNGLYLAPLTFVEHLLPHGFRVVGEA